jgi:hypothetical protein
MYTITLYQTRDNQWKARMEWGTDNNQISVGPAATCKEVLELCGEIAGLIDAFANVNFTITIVRKDHWVPEEDEDAWCCEFYAADHNYECDDHATWRGSWVDANNSEAWKTTPNWLCDKHKKEIENE